MRYMLMEGPRAGTSRPRAAISCRTVAAALALLVSSGLLGDARGETLRWKLKAGDVLRYTLEEKTVSSTKVMGRDIKTTRSQTVNLSWNVKSVSGTGDADITLRFDRVRMHLEQPPFMPFDFDSNAPRADYPEPFGAIALQVKAMAGAEFTFKIKPSGALEDVKIPERTLKTLRDGLGAEAAGQNMLSEQTLKDILTQSSPPPFPESSLEPGKSWTSRPTRLPTPIGTMVVNKVFTFQGPDPKTPKLMLVATETKVALEPEENATLTAKIGSQEGKGTFAFDADAGRIVNNHLTQKVEMQIAGPMEQKIDQTTETTSTMTLDAEP